jgi:hypothetical protein
VVAAFVFPRVLVAVEVPVVPVVVVEVLPFVTAFEADVEFPDCAAV